MAKQAYLNHLQWGSVLSEAWANAEFRQKLERDPTATIKAYARQRMGVELENVFQMPSPPKDLGVEALRSMSPSGHQSAAPGTVCGSGSAPGTVSGSGSAPGTVSGSGSAPGTVSGSGTSGAGGSDNS